MKLKGKKEKKSFFKTHPEVKGLLLLGCAMLLLFSFLSYHPTFPKENWLGLVGYGIGYGLSYMLGVGSFFFLLYIGYLGFKFLSQKDLGNIKIKHLYFAIFLFSSCLLLNLMAELKIPFPDILSQKVPIEIITLELPYPQTHIRHNLGGIPFYYLYCDLPTLNLVHLLSNFGVGITFSITAFISLLLLTEVKISQLLGILKKWRLWGIQHAQKIRLFKDTEPSLDTLDDLPHPIFPTAKSNPRVLVTQTSFSSKKTSMIRPRKILSEKTPSFGDYANYLLPPISLLRNPQKIDLSTLKKDLRRQAELLEETLTSFGIEAKVGEIHCGPTITSFEVHPSVGVKVQKIKALENDIALNLQARSIRIIAPIPGKAAVGVEVPSLIPQEVSFKEILVNYQEKKQKAQIPILLGKTVSGELVMSDLARMPHCIIAGATGSGKSVCINTIVVSIVMNARPDEIKLLMVDPKKVELTGYTKLPHMIAPVITEAHGAYAALSWLVKEMQIRYEILKQLGLRNIAAFNGRKRDISFEESLDLEIPKTMPKIVAIIDEFADLMMASSSDLETPIARIAQMARAVGIHLILATQRPSREVITGLIKANFPTRIAFKVASRINSQIILDETGAENLLGNGDMLFLPPGTSNLLRAQGTYISDEEINQVIQFICNQASPNYLIRSFDTMPKDDINILVNASDDSKDELYEQAFSIVTETGTASTTFLQRKLKIGYARAASLMDELEEKGVISPQEGAKPRRVLVNTPNANGRG